jgi:IS30 family transposase
MVPPKKTSVKRDLVSALHKPARINFKRRRVIIKGINETLQADLVEMIPYAKQNKQFQYILVVIDCFSKYTWTVPVKAKDSKHVTEAMEKVLSQQSVHLPKILQTDKGSEFYNSKFKALMKKYKMNHYSTFRTKKASIVERVNRNLKI